MFGLSAQILKERGQYRDVMDLGADSMALWSQGHGDGDLHLDIAYKAALTEFRQARKERPSSHGDLTRRPLPPLRGPVRGASSSARAAAAASSTSPRRSPRPSSPSSAVPCSRRHPRRSSPPAALRPPEVVFICGYLARAIQGRYPALDYVENPDWERNNILASLMYARSRMAGGFVSTYADIVYRPACVEARSVRSPPTTLTIVCDTAWRRPLRGPAPSTRRPTRRSCGRRGRRWWRSPGRSRRRRRRASSSG